MKLELTKDECLKMATAEGNAEVGAGSFHAVFLDDAVNRFLGWRVPENFAPDGGVKLDREYAAKYGSPTGTNLLDAVQARAMLAYVLGVDI
jgi:hypothetical protein